MAAIAEHIKPLSRRQEPLFATALPTLWPRMLWPRARPAAMPFPLNQPGAHYFYLGRSGVYEIARRLGLRGQEVLFPAYFQGVELEALLAAGVRPRFFPVHERMQVDAAEVAALIGPETRAIYLIHYAGFPGPVAELSAVCRERGLLLIEDCALALLSRLGDQPLGSFGDAAVYCFYKMLPTLHGAAVVLRVREFSFWARSTLPRGAAPSLVSVASYAVKSLLLNLEARGNTLGRWLRRAALSWGDRVLSAAGATREPVGALQFDLAQIELAMSGCVDVVLRAQDFDGIITRRRRNYAQLAQRLRHLSPPVFTELPPGVCPLFYPFRIANKQAAQDRLRGRGVEAIDFWRWPHPALPVGTFPAVDDLRRTVLWLPCHQDLSPDTVDRVADAVCAVVEEAQ
jgi:perosamine synthetase